MGGQQAQPPGAISLRAPALAGGRWAARPWRGTWHHGITQMFRGNKRERRRSRCGAHGRWAALAIGWSCSQAPCATWGISNASVGVRPGKPLRTPCICAHAGCAARRGAPLCRRLVFWRVGVHFGALRAPRNHTRARARPNAQVRCIGGARVCVVAAAPSPPCAAGAAASGEPRRAGSAVARGSLRRNQSRLCIRHAPCDDQDAAGLTAENAAGGLVQHSATHTCMRTRGAFEYTCSVCAFSRARPSGGAATTWAVGRKAAPAGRVARAGGGHL